MYLESAGDLMETKSYAAFVKDETILLNSSSGGMFTALSEIILEEGNFIVCPTYNGNSDQVEYAMIFDKEERDKCRGSKYIQSIPQDIFKNSEEYLLHNPGKMALFFGTGCQAAGFVSFMEMKKLRHRVIVVDIVCHGAPSPKIWRDYIATIKNGSEASIEQISFRDKRTGWESSSSYAKIEDKEVSLFRYKKYLYGPMTLRHSCYKCPFATVNRVTDITIGDFWGIKESYPEIYNPNGVSVVLVHTKLGLDLFEQSKNLLHWIETDIKNSLQPNLVHPTSKSPLREMFMKDYVTYGIEYILKKYADDTWKGKIRRKMMLARSRFHKRW